MIEISERIEVPAAPKTVWDVLSDPHVVVECVPGAELGEKQEDGSFNARLVVKFGPAKVAFQAKVALELDAASMSGSVVSRGKDGIGGTRVVSTMKFKVQERTDAPGTVVPIDAQVEISGKLASLIESGASLVTKRMVRDFTERLTATVNGAPMPDLRLTAYGSRLTAYGSRLTAHDLRLTTYGSRLTAYGSQITDH
jgi:carbon monoxide dehydrogenase subunit G